MYDNPIRIKTEHRVTLDGENFTEWRPGNAKNVSHADPKVLENVYPDEAYISVRKFVEADGITRIINGEILAARLNLNDLENDEELRIFAKTKIQVLSVLRDVIEDKIKNNSVEF